MDALTPARDAPSTLRVGALHERMLLQREDNRTTIISCKFAGRYEDLSCYGRGNSRESCCCMRCHRPQYAYWNCRCRRPAKPNQILSQTFRWQDAGSICAPRRYVFRHWECMAKIAARSSRRRRRQSYSRARAIGPFENSSDTL